MRPYEASQIAKVLTAVVTDSAFECMSEEGIRSVARAVLYVELRAMGVPNTESVSNARNAIIRATIRLYNTHDGSDDSTSQIRDYLEGYVTGAFETADVMRW